MLPTNRVHLRFSFSSWRTSFVITVLELAYPILEPTLHNYFVLGEEFHGVFALTMHYAK
jgi:hypothetical protein